MVHYDIKVHGKVQGVFFRQSAKVKAKGLGVSGYVQNNDDGTVQIHAEGKEDDVKKFLNWCKKGPENADVEKVEFRKTLDFKNYNDFFVR